MNKFDRNFLLAVLIFPLSLMAIDHEDSVKYMNWQNLDLKTDKIMGVSVEKAYNELLQGKESETVIVAVIDGGVDINHEDLKDIIWVNENEIPGNGIDDDNNGYIDDIHGWNFIGNDKGENINYAPMEVTRLVRSYQNMFADMDDDSIKNSGKVDFDYYQNVKNTYDLEKLQVDQNLEAINKLSDRYNRYDSIVKLLLGKEEYTLSDLKKLKVEKKSIEDTAKKFLTRTIIRKLDKNSLKEYQEYFNERHNYHYNTEFTAREIIGDDEYVWTEKVYGNNDVAGEDPEHGTMVSGIIGAVRNNNIGINGIANNVKIMSIRTVPNGDEWDKDVASAIKYAIDNGAEIINMSFGKGFSPQKEFVDSIAKLVDQSNVLLIQASGNDGMNNDFVTNYPNKYSPEGEILANNWLTVGASTISSKKKALVADFSNYGKKNVDIFAPGDNILLCAPENKYDIASGTSFAAPVVTGVAALVKSYYPSLTAVELKDIILQSAYLTDYKVILPGTYGKHKEIVNFSSLSATGGVVNVYNALLLAEEKTKK
jgi:subtilisin family serine protease